MNDKYKTLGYFSTPEEANQAYIKAKKEYCILVANKEYNEGNIDLDIQNAIISRANSMI